MCMADKRLVWCIWISSPCFRTLSWDSGSRWTVIAIVSRLVKSKAPKWLTAISLTPLEESKSEPSSSHFSLWLVTNLISFCLFYLSFLNNSLPSQLTIVYFLLCWELQFISGIQRRIFLHQQSFLLKNERKYENLLCSDGLPCFVPRLKILAAVATLLITPCAGFTFAG